MPNLVGNPVLPDVFYWMPDQAGHDDVGWITWSGQVMTMQEPEYDISLSLSKSLQGNILSAWIYTKFLL